MSRVDQERRQTLAEWHRVNFWLALLVAICAWLIVGVMIAVHLGWIQ